MAEDNYANLIAENARRRMLNKELRARVAELERQNSKYQSEIQNLNQRIEEQAAEFEETLEGLSESDLVQTIENLNGELLTLKLNQQFTTKAGSTLAAGADFDAVIRSLGINPADLNPDEINDAFIDELVAEAKAQAPYLFKPEQPEAPAEQESPTPSGSSRDLAAAAVRRLPTFATVRGSGGGAPPPAEPPGSTARLRDPADALRRAAEARAARNTSQD